MESLEPEPPDPVRRPAWRRWLDRGLLVAGLALLVFVISRFPLDEIGRACLHLGPVVLVTPLITLASMVASAASLGTLAGSVPKRALMWNRVVGEGFNTLLPAGIAGEPFKIRHLARHVPRPRAIVAVVNDYFIDTVVGLLLSAGAIAISVELLDTPPHLRAGMISYSIVATVVAAGIATMITLAATGRIAARWFRGAAVRVAQRRFAIAVLCSIAARLILIAEIVLLLWLLEIEPTVARVMFIAGANAAAGYLGFAVPQAIGVTEAATVGVFAFLALPAPAALAFALARRGRMLVMGAVGVALYLAARDRR